MPGRLLRQASLVLCLASTTEALAQADLVVDHDMYVSGAYHNITVLKGRTVTLSGAVDVSGLFDVRQGAVAFTGDNRITGHAFALRDSAVLEIACADGVPGCIMTSNRTFESGARFVFDGVVPQMTGPEFPDEVRSIDINNRRGVTMSKPLVITQRLMLLNGDFKTNGQLLTLASRPSTAPGTLSGTAIVANINGRVIGNVKVERHIDGNLNSGAGYRHYASPVSATTVADFNTTGFHVVVNPAYNTTPYGQRFVPGAVTPYPNIFTYDQSQVTTSGNPGTYDFDKGWQSPASLSDPVRPMQGFTINVSAIRKLDLVGELNNGNITSASMPRGGQTDAGWYFMGNPYPSKLDWNGVVAMDDGSNVMFDQVSLYRSTGLGSGYYDTYVNGIGSARFIGQMQGFFVRTKQGAPTLTLTNAARLIDFEPTPNTPFYRQTTPNPTADIRPQLRLELSGNQQTEPTYLYFQDGATGAVDAKYDGFHLDAGHGISFATTIGAEKLSINGMPALTAATDVTVPLAVRVAQAGQYRIDAAQLLNLPSGVRVLLQDAATNYVQDLTLNPGYSFAATPQDAANRFSVRITANRVTGTTAEAAQPAANLEVFPNPVSQNQQAVTLNMPAALNGEVVRATLVDQVGRTIWNQNLPATLGGVREDIPLNGLDRGVYTLRVASAAGIQSRQVVIQ